MAVAANSVSANDRHRHRPQSRPGWCSRMSTRIFLRPFIESTPDSVRWILYLSVFVDLLGASIVVPILPFYATAFGADSTQVGGIMTGYAATQLVSMLIMGSLSDRIGRRPALLINIFGSVVGFIAQGIAWDLTSFIIFRTASGIFGGSPPIVQAVIADLFPKEERPAYLALVGGVTAAAYCFGPAVGAGLSEFSLETPMYVGAGVAFANLVFALFIIPETNPKVLSEYRAVDTQDAEIIKAGAKVKRIDDDSDNEGEDEDEGEDDSDNEEGDAGADAAPKKKTVIDSDREGEDEDEGEEKGLADADAGGGKLTIVVEDDFVKQQKLRAFNIERLDSFGDPLTGGIELRKRGKATSVGGGDDGNSDGDKADKEEDEDDEDSNIHWAAVIFTCLTNFMNVLGFTAFNSMFALYMADVFNLGSGELGFIFTGVAVIFMLTQAVIWNAIRSKIGIVATAVIGCALQAVGLATIPVPDSLPLILPSLFLVAFGCSLVDPMMPSVLSQSAGEKAQGGVLSLGNAVAAAARMIGPLVMGFVYDFDVSLPFYIGGGIAALNFLQIFVIWITKVLPNEPRSISDDERRFKDLVGSYKKDDGDEWGSKADVDKIGHYLAALLATRHYKWVTYYGQLENHLRLVFPPLKPGQKTSGFRSLQEGSSYTFHRWFHVNLE